MLILDKNWFVTMSYSECYECCDENTYEEIAFELNHRYCSIVAEKTATHWKITLNLHEYYMDLCGTQYNVNAICTPTLIEELLTICTQWLTQNYSVVQLQLQYPTLIVYDVYPYYQKGVKGLIEYEWECMEKDIKKDFILDFEGLPILYNLCSQSTILRQLTPRITHGKLCLTVKNIKQSKEIYFYHLFYYNNFFWVGNQNHSILYLFTSAEETIKHIETQAQGFLEQHKEVYRDI